MNGSACIDSIEKACQLYPASGNKRAYLQQACDYKIVAARPDFKFQLYNALSGKFRTGFGFVLLNEGKPESFEFMQTDQKFSNGALPILAQSISQKGFRFHQESFTTRDEKGRGVVLLRLSIWRDKGEPSDLELGFLMTRAHSADNSTHSNDDYIPFEPWGNAWELPTMCEGDERMLHDRDYIVAACKHSRGVSAQAVKGPCALAWRFEANVKRDEIEVIEITVPYECGQLSAGSNDNRDDFQKPLSFRIAQIE